MKLKDWQVKRLEKAKKASVREKLLLVVLDDEEAAFALLKDFGFEERGKVFSGKSGTSDPCNIFSDTVFY